MTHPQVFSQKFTPIRRFSAWKTHPFWPHIPNMTQYGSAPREKNAPVDGVLARFFRPGGGEFAHQKSAQGFCPRRGGMVRLGID